MSDDFGAKLLQLILVRAMEGESQIQEHVQWNRETKGWVPLAQAGGAILGVMLLAVGLGLLGWGTTRAMDIPIDFQGALLIGVLLMLGLAGVYVLARRAFHTSPAVVAAGLGTALFLVVVAALLMAILGDGVDIPAAAALATAPAVLVGGLSLAYRQLVDLLDPYGKTSPMERMLQPYLKQLFIGSQDQANRLTVPYRINGALREPVSELNQGDPVVRIHRDDLALIEFVREAQERGLSRRRWLPKGQPNVILPRSGLEIGRDIYDDMMNRLTEWGIVSPGGEGKASHWMMSGEAALELIEREIVAQLVEGQRA